MNAAEHVRRLDELVRGWNEILHPADAIAELRDARGTWWWATLEELPWGQDWRSDELT